MAKLSEDKVLDYISELPIDTQIQWFEMVKSLVAVNVQKHQQELEDKANQYQQISDRINNVQ